MDHSNDSNDDQEDEFLFESTHLALRNNPDYLMLMRHLTVLCAKRIQVHRDIEEVRAARLKASEDPLLFVEQLKQGSINLPLPIDIPKIPIIDFTKYGVNESTNLKEQTTHLSTSVHEKSQSVNFWTVDEQRRLEELLHEYKPEPVESQRFVKIAKAMGNRTPKQIASRVQKFFKKLHDANLPIPGTSTHKSLRNRSQKSYKFKLERPSTFFPERNIPSDLLMKDGSDDEVEMSTLKTQSSIDLTRDEKHQKILALLKRVRQAKQEADNFAASSGHKCISCDDDLLIGGRWNCIGCQTVINYCSDCFTTQLVGDSFIHLHHDIQLR